MSAEPLRTNKATFTACIQGLVTAASATDVVTIQGVNGRRIELDRIEIIGAASSGSAPPTALIRRSTAASGGTSSAITPVAVDSKVALVSGVAILAFTANPTVGTPVGNLWVGRTRFIAVTAVAPPGTTVIDASQLNAGPFVLNSASEFWAINFGATTIAAPLVDIFIRWTEYFYPADGING